MTDPNVNILIVDDEPSLRLAFEATFKAEGFGVTCAPEGASALSEIKDNDSSFDAMVLDLRMPGIDGLGVIKDLHGSGITVPTLLTSAYMDTATAVKAAYYGVVDCLKKPSTPAELRNAVFQLIKDTERFSGQDSFDGEPYDMYRWAKWNISEGNYEKALQLLEQLENGDNQKGLASWKVICSHLSAITDDGNKTPDFASRNFYEATNLLDNIALN